MRIIVSILLMLNFFILVGSGRAEPEIKVESKGQSSFLQLSLFPPLQLVNMDNPIEGFRFGLVPVNSDMTGLDIGVVTWTSQDLAALQIGLVNVVGNNAGGVQFGTVNIIEARGIGWQSALLNVNGNGFVGFQQGGANIVLGEQSCVGLQFGAVNYARNMVGVQLGLVNITPNLSGIQIGIINYAGNSPLPILPLANAAF